MLIHAAKPLFAWSELEDVPQLRTIKEILTSLPDQALLDGLAAARGNGRDDYPLSVLWGVVLLSILCRHEHFEDCLDELQRNPTLCVLIGINSPAAIPNGWNLSRFLDTLGQQPHLDNSRAIFDALVKRLGDAVPGLGRHTAGDSTALAGRAKKSVGAVAEETRQGLPQPSGGRKEYKDDEGKVTKVYEWFGYKLHLLVDVDNEVSLAYAITDTKAGDNEMIEPLVEQAQANLPQGRIETLAYDKAADDGKVHQTLNERGIKPVIQVRQMWKGEKEKPLRVGLPVVYDEAGTVSCYDTQSEPPVQRKMAYVGHEKDRGTVRYRCPAVYEGFRCASHEKCNEGKKYGLSVRIKIEEDFRRFPAIPRATKQFEERYKGRTAVERVNARLKIFWGADDGNVVGARRFHGFVGAVMVIHAAVALWLAAQPRWEGTLGNTRLSPIAQMLARLDGTQSEPADVP
jgi:DDE family transposase